MAENFVSMEITPEERKEEASPAVIGGYQNKYPYGLCISLTHEELEKLDMDDDLKAGDEVEMEVRAKVTCVSKTDTTNGQCCRIEMQITAIAVEGEEEEPEEEPRKLGRQLPYK